MKRAIYVMPALLALFLSMLIVSHGYAQQKYRSTIPEWLLIETTATTKFYRNTKRVLITDEGNILAWEKRFHRTDTPEGRENIKDWVGVLTPLVGRDKARNYSYMVELTEYDCKGRKFRTLRYIAFDVEDNILRVASLEDPEVDPGDMLGIWKPVKPNSVPEAMMKSACSAATSK
jgi:hypothetical protein